jgi:hypothetical protein
VYEELRDTIPMAPESAMVARGRTRAEEHDAATPLGVLLNHV